jgi:hypothetical protein
LKDPGRRPGTVLLLALAVGAASLALSALLH